MTREYDLPRDRAALHEEVGRRLAGSRAYQQLDAPTRQAVHESLIRITEYLTSETTDGRPTAGQQAAAEAMRPTFGGAFSLSQSGPPPSGTSVRDASASGAGEAAPSALHSVDFPALVGGLIQGTFQAIVNASIQQMEAYAKLLKDVSADIEQFAREDRREEKPK